jgi:hypothetical protein
LYSFGSYQQLPKGESQQRILKMLTGIFRVTLSVFSKNKKKVKRKEYIHFCIAFSNIHFPKNYKRFWLSGSRKSLHLILFFILLFMAITTKGLKVNHVNLQVLIRKFIELHDKQVLISIVVVLMNWGYKRTISRFSTNLVITYRK